MKISILFYFILLLNVSNAFCQSGEISGKLIIETDEERNSLPKKVFAILRNETSKDSMQVDENLNFKFENLSSGKYNLSFSVRNYPTNRTYNYYLKENEKFNKDIELKTICPFRNLKEKSDCPVCKKSDKVIPISYGLSVSIISKDEKENSKSERKVYEGGCVVSDCQPNWYCERDETKF